MSHGPGTGSKLDPKNWVDKYGDELFRHAAYVVGDRQIAEDLVQETFLAAWKGRSAFRGQASEKTWLLNILKHKIVDFLRKKYGRKEEIPTGDDATLEQLFDAKGNWKVRFTKKAGDPFAAAERREFWQAFFRCLEALPDRWASAFALKELEGVKSDAICACLGISPQNFWVIMHRARLRLVHCLEVNWFRTDNDKGR